MIRRSISLISATVLVAALISVPFKASAASPPTCDGKPATIVGTAGFHVLMGTPGRDVIVGGGSNDIQALGGNDLICSPSNLDSIVAGAGDDKILGGELIDGGPGRDTIIATATDTIFGGPGDDRIIANNFVSSISGGLGNDFIEAHGSIFATNGDEGDDVIVETNGNNTRGGAGNDLLIGRGNGGNLFGGPGDDIGVADPGASVIFWDEAGDDIYYGADNPKTVVNYYFSPNAVHVDLRTGLATGNGNDRLIAVRSMAGSHQADVLIGDQHANMITGLIWEADNGDDPERAGADYIRGLGGKDTIFALGAGTRAYGDGGNDTVTAASHVFGGRGNDTLTGGFFNDTLIGGPGFDHVDGAEGTDRCTGERLVNCELR